MGEVPGSKLSSVLQQTINPSEQREVLGLNFISKVRRRYEVMSEALAGSVVMS